MRSWARRRVVLDLNIAVFFIQLHLMVKLVSYYSITYYTPPYSVQEYFAC